MFRGFAYAAAGSLDAAQRDDELKSAEWTDNGDIWPQTTRLHGAAIAHYELGRIHQEQGDCTAALDKYEIFLEMWSKADEGLPRLEDARLQVAALR